jgi:hypothetical protein
MKLVYISLLLSYLIVDNFFLGIRQTFFLASSQRSNAALVETVTQLWINQFVPSRFISKSRLHFVRFRLPGELKFCPIPMTLHGTVFFFFTDVCSQNKRRGDEIKVYVKFVEFSILISIQRKQIIIIIVIIII